MRIITNSQLFNGETGWVLATLTPISDLKPKTRGDETVKVNDKTVYRFPAKVLARGRDGQMHEANNVTIGILNPDAQMQPGGFYEFKGTIWVTPYTSERTGNRVQYSLIVDDIAEKQAK